MLTHIISLTHYPTGHISDPTHETHFFTYFLIDYFKSLLMTRDLDVFMSWKDLGLNGLSLFHELN